MKEASLVEIGFKSGNSISIWFKEFKIKYSGDSINSMELIVLDKNIQIMNIALSEIEYVIVKKKKTLWW
jgi:hypothetical protein